jgi:predicted ester cyclase
MQQRRGFLKLLTTALAGVVVAPFRALFGAEKTTAPAPAAARPVNAAPAVAASAVSAADQQVVRAFYAEGWTGGSRQVLAGHPATAQQCAHLFDRFRGAFPDLKINVQSIQRNGDQILVRWSAQGTQKGPLDGIAPTGRRASAAGLTKMKIVDGKIVSTVAEWDEAALKAQLAPRKLG